MPYIYRVENKQGRGPYQGGVPNYLKYHDRNTAKRPVPRLDEGIERTPFPEEICGFMTLDQVNNWFSPHDLKKLRENGYELKRVLVENIIIGKTQVIARRKEVQYEQTI